MWWQHITLSADNNLFVQFSWPSQMQTNSYLKSSSESKGYYIYKIQKKTKGYYSFITDQRSEKYPLLSQKKVIGNFNRE